MIFICGRPTFSLQRNTLERKLRKYSRWGHIIQVLNQHELSILDNYQTTLSPELL